jgi:hypothetical protein
MGLENKMITGDGIESTSIFKKCATFCQEITYTKITCKSRLPWLYPILNVRILKLYDMD